MAQAGGQGRAQIIVVLRLGSVAQRAAGKANDITGAPLGSRELLSGMNNGTAQLLRPQPFGFKKSTVSLRINLSSSSSAMIFLSR